MNWTIIIIEAIVLTAAFTAMILIPLVKNPVWWIADVRLPGTENMDSAYHQKKYHFVQSCWGMLIGLIPCLIGAWLYAWLFC